MLSRRKLLKAASGMVGAGLVTSGCATRRRVDQEPQPPNVVFVFADQWRAQATGYAGDPNVRTPVLDSLAGRSVRFTNAVSTCPVCAPWRACLITGQYPLTHGVFMNDVHLNEQAVSIARAYQAAGYRTAYVGKWHLDGRGRSAYIPPDRRQGFEYWKVLECTHDYNRSAYWADQPVKLMWEGYDALAQTRDAQQYIRQREKDKPFALFLSWGPPHNPYETAPQRFRQMYNPAQLSLRPNVPSKAQAQARTDLAGYYAHCSALDECLGQLIGTIRDEGIEDDTVLVFTSDHGDMLGSQGLTRKQTPYDESILVPMLIRWPRIGSRVITEPIGAPDLMPTLLGLCDIPIPKTVEGKDRSAIVSGAQSSSDEPALIACYTPFGEWTRVNGGREYRGIRTQRWSYVRDLNGPWLMFDNQKDPHQMQNLVGNSQYAGTQAELDRALSRKLEQTQDEFRPGKHYIDKWGYLTDTTGTVPYKN